MSKKRTNTARNRRTARDRSSKLGIFVVSTVEGAAIEVGDGPGSVRLELGVEKAIEVASAIMVAILPAAIQEGGSLESIADKMFLSLTEHCRSASAHMDEMPS